MIVRARRVPTGFQVFWRCRRLEAGASPALSERIRYLHCGGFETHYAEYGERPKKDASVAIVRKTASHS
jgi:hypothetical protein